MATMNKRNNRIAILPFSQFKQKYHRKGLLKTAPPGFGSFQIWQCMDKTTYETLSIKVIKKSDRINPRVLREVAILKECNSHPNLLHVRSVYECKKFYYIITDSLAHPDLLKTFESLLSKSQAGPERVAVIVAGLLNALVFLHDPNHPTKSRKQEIVHGNINPGTVLVPTKKVLENFMLVDFSFADMDIGVDIPDTDMDTSTIDSPFRPPEYAETGPTTKGDLYAVGALTFLLLTGNYPFQSDQDKLHPIQEWHGIRDPACKQFLQLLLAPDPAVRPTAKEANRRDSWFNAVAEFTVDLYDFSQVMERLGKINKEHEFQVAVRSYISTTLSRQSELTHLNQAFRVADRDNSGCLDREEFRLAMINAGIDFLDEQAIESYFDTLDKDGSNSISYTEFIAYAEDQEKMFEKKKLRTAFDAFDVTNAGYITADSLKKFARSADGANAFSGEKKLCNRMILDMIKRADQDGDGKISFDEFADMMSKRPNSAKPKR